MASQTINIEKNTGTINIFNGSEEKKSKTAETITIAAIDKYSTPLIADIEITPWGEKMHRVSFLMRNALINQVLQQNYLTFKTKEKAKEVFKNIISMMKDFKKEAETKLIHSAILVPRIWNKMSLLEKESEIPKPESADIINRFRMDDIHEHFQGSIPAGLLLHPIDEHFEEHIKADSNNWYKVGHMMSKVGLKKTAVKVKTASISLQSKDVNNIIKDFNDITEKWENKEFDIKKYANSMAISLDDNNQVKQLKKEAFTLIRPLLLYDDIKPLKTKENSIECAIKSMGQVVFEKIAQSKKINIDKYDVFIFDADETIWEGEYASNMIEPYKLEDKLTISDSEGKKILLKSGIREILIQLRMLGKDLGIISKSEKMNVDYQDQPVVRLLKEFDILKFFNKMVVVDGSIPKSVFIPSGERTIFIDDQIKNILDVDLHSDADAFNVEKIDINPREKTIEIEENDVSIDDLNKEDKEEIEKIDSWKY